MTLARRLAARGDMLGCARELEQVPYWWPQRAEALFRSAQAFLMADRARDAEAALLAILDDDPLHPPDPGLYHDAGQELLKIYATEDRWEDAYGVIWKAYDHAAPPDRPLMLTMRIRCELERVAPTETLKVLRRYVAADPADFEARRAMANAELAMASGPRPLRDMEACLAGRPDDARAWRDYLAMLQSLGEQDAFNAAMARLPRSAESEPEIWMFRGQIKERNGDWPGPPTTTAGRWSSTRTCSTPTIGWPRSRRGWATASKPPPIASGGMQSARRAVHCARRMPRSAPRSPPPRPPRNPRRGPDRAAGRDEAAGVGLRALGWSRAAAACSQIAATSDLPAIPALPDETGRDEVDATSGFGDSMALAALLLLGTAAHWAAGLAESGRPSRRSAGARPAAYDRGDWDGRGAARPRERLKAAADDPEGLRLMAAPWPARGGTPWRRVLYRRLGSAGAPRRGSLPAGTVPAAGPGADSVGPASSGGVARSLDPRHAETLFELTRAYFSIGPPDGCDAGRQRTGRAARAGSRGPRRCWARSSSRATTRPAPPIPGGARSIAPAGGPCRKACPSPIVPRTEFASRLAPRRPARPRRGTSSGSPWPRRPTPRPPGS